MAMQINGMSATLSTFREIDRRFNAAVAAELAAGAKEIAKLARDLAPTDRGDLVRSIRAQRINTSHATAWRVKVGGIMGGRDVNEYAWIMHERLEYTRGEKTNVKGGYNPRKRSRAKAARLGVVVGRHFLTRAYRALEKDIQIRVRQAVQSQAQQIAGRSPRRKK